MRIGHLHLDYVILAKVASHRFKAEEATLFFIFVSFDKERQLFYS